MRGVRAFIAFGALRGPEASVAFHRRIDGSLSIPLGEIARRLVELPRDRALVMVCHTGRRSQHAAMLLAEAGFAVVQNLQGGVEAWALEVDPAVKRY